jgi:predicted alpha/beta-hydrolase family hydrolase
MLVDSNAEALTITVGDAGRVSGLLQVPAGARICFVLAHGAGAGMSHPFMAGVADGLAERGIATMRYQFPYMEQGSKRPDAPKLAQATVRAAVIETSRLLPRLDLVAGGKSFGGRMTSQVQAETPLSGVRGLVFLGFPLHPRGRPSHERAEHLFEVKIPMLFLQGTRDALADIHLMRQLAERLGPRATLKLFEDADHSFHVPARTGRKDADIRSEMLDALAGWVKAMVAPNGHSEKAPPTSKVSPSRTRQTC